MKNKCPKIIMIHSVGSTETQWCDRKLSLDAGQFSQFCKYLNRKKIHSGFLNEWYQEEEQMLEHPENRVYLTFDDGYLDNLLVAYPVMKKYGVRGTIFINPEFVDPSSGVRTLETQNGNTLGFLNWDEIRFLDQSRVFDVQSHSMSHNFYFASDKLVDVYEGQNSYHWMPWMAQNDKKMYWQDHDQSFFVPFGTPVFEKGRALGLRRYFPDEQLNQLGISLYNQGLSKKEILLQLQDAQDHNPGKFESDEDMEKRYRYELFDSKRILEDQLGKKIEFLCWPGGGYNELSLKLAEEAGYKASTISSKDKGEINNKASYKRMKRKGFSSVVCKKGNYYFIRNKYYLCWLYQSLNNNYLSRCLVEASRKLALYRIV